MSTKKRKVVEGGSIKPATFDNDTNDTPLLVTLPDFPTKPHSVKFQTFVRSENESELVRKKLRIVVGQTSKLEYVGDNAGNKRYCRYVIGIFDKNTKQLTLRESDVFRMATTVKTLKRHESKHIAEKNMLARNALGEAFGTKKRRQAIRALEKNVVDVRGMAEVEDVIKGAIDEKAATLPSRDEIRQEAQLDRCIPPYNLQAQSPADVYNVEDIITPAELQAIPFKQIWRARAASDVKELLEPISPTSWVWDKIHVCLQVKDDSVRMRRLIYLAYLMKFHGFKDKDLNSQAVGKRLGGAPQIVAERLMNEFTEFQEDEGRRRYRMAPKLQDKLRAYILTLCLILNDFKVDASHIARDLGIAVNKMNDIAKELGCKHQQVKNPEGKSMKRMALTVPLVFPQRTR
ncbi:hypothetical protein SpCBS45565_g06662 [Spizellomyces sp. 'palustris']|nr:hypothetical protein SpCBS45565_g06662 [Spizellomyces sp. 'palustris']